MTSVNHAELTAALKPSCLRLCSDILFELEVMKELPARKDVELNDLQNQATVNLLLKLEQNFKPTYHQK